MTIDRRRFLIAASIASTAGVAGFANALRPAAAAAEPLRVAFVPEVATTADSLAAKQPWIDYFQAKLNRPVKLTIPTNYAATVEAIGNGSVDIAHFGGLTYVKAQARYGVLPLVQRVEDRHFHSLFITNDPALKTLKDVAGKTFAFGDVNSTSGHLIPAEELLAIGIDPDTGLASPRFTGNHTTTAIAVNSGQVVAGALDESVYRKLVADKTIDGTSKARVFFTSRPFVDYVWAARKDLAPATIALVRETFLGIKDKSVLDVTRASAYVVADDREYDGIRATAKRLNLL